LTHLYELTQIPYILKTKVLCKVQAVLLNRVYAACPVKSEVIAQDGETPPDPPAAKYGVRLCSTEDCVQTSLATQSIDNGSYVDHVERTYPNRPGDQMIINWRMRLNLDPRSYL